MAEAMAEALLLPIVNSILEKLTSNAFEQLIAAKSAKKDLQKIAAKLSAICAVLEDAEKQQYSNAAIKVWLRGLKSVVYDINDLLDEVATDALQRTVVNKGRTLDQLRYYLSSSNPLLSRFGLSHKIRDLREKIDSIVAQKNDFDLIQNPTRTPVFERNPFDACPDVGRSTVIGREEAKQDIINKLSKVVDDASCPTVLPIVGMGGLGKTALAKLVYQDLPAEFDIKLWACVTEKFDRRKIIEDLVKSATNENTSNQDLNWLVKKIQDLLRGKKYFIVLDDVWLEDKNIWTEFKSILEVGEPGSVVLVTTRLPNVASITQTIGPAYNLDRLPTEVCWPIFKQLVFKEGEEQRYPNLVKIGTSIIEKCHGVALVVKTLGGMLCNQRNEQEWERIDKMESFTELSSDYDSVMGVLKLSYDRLPPHLKPCVATCSLFMKGGFYYHQNSTYFWSALGLLPTNRYDEIESAGYAYFMELISRSFLQEPEMNYDGIVYICKMHDFFHDLALNIMGEELAVVTSDKLGISETCRHIIWDYEDLSDKKQLPEEILKAVKAQTFKFGYKMGRVSQSIIEGIISNFSTLRILDLRDSSFEKLPSSIGNLKHLRVLDLSFNPIIRRLPKTICNLLNLQLIDTAGCEQLKELPKKMDKLVSLRYLGVTTKQLSLSGTGITGLRNLRRLNLIRCGELVSLREEDDDDDDVAAIGGLTSLRHCYIADCPKLTHLPNNMKFLTALKELSIEGCEALELEKGEGLCGLKNLRSLVIDRVPKLERLPDALLKSSTVQYLFIKYCEGLTELSDGFQQFVSLKRLFIYNCPNLVALPVGLTRLTSMEVLGIKNCPHLTERCGVPNGPDYSLIRHVPEIWLDGRRKFYSQC